MSTSKHMDLICCIAAILATVLVILFLNGEALGIAPAVNGEQMEGYFTANDRNGDWDTSHATQITLAGSGGTVSGNGAYISEGNVHIVYAGSYVISGQLTDGSIVVDADGDDKIWILLNGVDISCSDNAAIRVEQAEHVFLTLADGTENTLSSGSAYGEQAIANGVDGTIYARDDLTINGSGSLSVHSAYKHGIVCNDDLVICGGTITVEAVEDGIHANDSGRFADMDLTINAGDDGVTVSNDEGTGYIYVESGTMTIPSCYEGLEAVDITIAGGRIDITPSDDGVNANGDVGTSVLRITGGDISIVNPTGRDADGLDSNGSIYITGGTLMISVANDGGSCAIDYGRENGGVCQISGGTIIACGSGSMTEEMDSSSTQCSVMYNFSPAASAGTILTMTDSMGNAIVSQEIPCSFSSAVVSTPELRLGETYTITAGEVSQEITLSQTATTYGSMGGMMGGMGGNRGRGFGGMPQDGTGEMPPMPEDFDESMMAGKGQRPTPPEGFDDRPEFSEDMTWPTDEAADEEQAMDFDQNRGNRRQWGSPEEFTPDSERLAQTSDDSTVKNALAGASVVVLILGLAFALVKKY